MDKPLEITFRDMDRSEAIASVIEKKCLGLERFYHHITHVHVMIRAQSGRHRKGNGYEVRIEIHVPGKTLISSHWPAAEFRHKKITPAINDAFKTITRQLEDYARRQRGEVKRHEIETPVQEPVPAVSGVAPADLTERMCKWPIGDPREPGFMFCGSDILPGAPYCRKHAALAYQASAAMHQALGESFKKKSRLEKTA